MQGLAVQFADVFLTFALQAAAAWLLCKCCVRLLRRPQHRFLAWLIFLVAAGAYWVWLMAGLGLEIFRPATTLGGLLSRGVSAYGRFHLPAAWLIGFRFLIAAMFLAYVACLVILAGRLAVRSFRLRKLLALATPPSPELAGLFHELRAQAGVRRCELQLLPGLLSPATVFSLKPRILVPESLDHPGPGEQFADVLRHELAHIARHDYLIAALSDSICALLLFHPAVWYARKCMRLERELACDLAVVEACPERRADYADTLAHFVRQHVLYRRTMLGVDFAGSPSFLLQRVRCILAEPINTPWWKKLSAATAGFAMFTVFAVYVPALAIVLDFASRPAAVSQPVSPEPVTRTASVSVKVRPARSTSAPRPYVYPDDLSTLRVQERTVESMEIRAHARPAGDTLGGGPDYTPAAWQERSPASPRFPAPSASSILLSTIGGAVYSEKKEHGTHGHGK
jgi:beta-lactamase regulating signal transducer with metallopeptidase domain